MTNKSLLEPVWVVIPAAGVGKRMQLEYPKQYLKIHGKSLLEHTLDCFIENDQIAGVVLVMNADDPYWHELEYSQEKPLHTVIGGKNRSDSVVQGLEYLKETIRVPVDNWILVHDAVRPCVANADINALLKLRESDHVGGLLASPVRDTMKRSELNDTNSSVLTTEPRDNLWHALTPQMFRLGDLLEALIYNEEQQLNITDESSAMENMGHKPMLIKGSHNNIKVTEQSDIELASFLLSSASKNKEE